MHQTSEMALALASLVDALPCHNDATGQPQSKWGSGQFEISLAPAAF
jgi:hypothetical protein